jgi:hypothetical protein
MNFGSKMCTAPYEAPRTVQIGSLARRKKSFLAICDGGRVVRFLGLPQAVSRLDNQNVGSFLYTPCTFLETRDAF